MTRVKAILWLHTLRLWRYKWSFLNLIMSTAMWIFLFMLGVLLFVPHQYLDTACKVAYWVIVAWNIISHCSGLIGGWMMFFTSIGMVEEHMLCGVSPFKVILGRVVPSTSAIVGSLILIAEIMNGAFNVDVFAVANPWLLVLGLALLTLQSLSYGLILAAIAVRTSVPHNLIDILNMAAIGLLFIPLTQLPRYTAVVLLCIPYVAPTHLAKQALSTTPALVPEAIAISLVEAVAMAVIAVKAVAKAEEYVKRNGVKAIGFF